MQAEGSDHTKSIVPFEEGSRLLPVLRSSGLVSLPCRDAVRLQKGCAMLLALAMPGSCKAV